MCCDWTRKVTHLNLRPDEVEDIYFTGALTDPAKTEFFVEYKDDKGNALERQGLEGVHLGSRVVRTILNSRFLFYGKKESMLAVN